MRAHRFIASLLIVIVALTACTQSATPTVGIDAQVQTAIAATAAASATFQAAVNQAAQATVSALPPTPTPGPSVDSYSLTEEELAGLIDQAVDEALAASDQAYAATTESTSDGTITSDEAYSTTTYVYDAEAAVAYAEELMNEYYDLYGDYASEAIDSLNAIDSDLEDISASLDEISTVLEQGADAATAAIDQLNAAVSDTQAQVADAQAAAQDWTAKVQTGIQQREDQLLSLAPTEIPDSREAALQQIFTYLDTVKSALGDNKISPDELNQIAQLAANARAGILAHGGPELQNLLGGMDGLTRQLARGEWPQARQGLGGFERSLPQRPPRPGRP
jgi:hypothetical protein